jgi:hypothetical protein
LQWLFQETYSRVETGRRTRAFVRQRNQFCVSAGIASQA